MRLPLVFVKLTWVMTSLSGIFSTQLSNTKLIKVDVSDTGDTSQFVDWLVSTLVCDIKEAKEEAKEAKEEAKEAKEEAKEAKEEAKEAKEKARVANEEARVAKEEAKNLKISLDFNTEIEMFLKDEKIHELEVYINKLKDDVQKIKDVVK